MQSMILWTINLQVYIQGRILNASIVDAHRFEQQFSLEIVLVLIIRIKKN